MRMYITMVQEGYQSLPRWRGTGRLMVKAMVHYVHAYLWHAPR
jgi:hypothetical protein